MVNENKMVRQSKYDYVISVPLITSLLLLVFVPVLFGYNAANVLNKYFSLIVVLAMFLLLLAKDVKVKTIDWIVIALSMFSTVLAKDFSLMAPAVLIMLMICFDNLKCDKLLLYYFVIYLFFMLFIVGKYYLFNNGVHDVMMWRVDGFVTRKSLGFAHPNIFMVEYVGLCFSLLLILKKKRFVYLLLMVLTSFLFYLTKSRTEFYMIMVALVAMLIWNKRLNNPISKSMKSILALSPLFLLLASSLLIIYSNNEFLNLHLSGRPVLYRQFFDSSGITLFGNSSLESEMFDNGYLQMFLSKGLITFVGYLMAMWRLIFSHKVNFRIFIVLMALYFCAVTETILFKFELILPLIIYLSENSQRISND
ncbi:hypothetical protein [Companilactobacillus zhongbaensis]|uniref:hypothetical protein n=1 Tax=Companilactobacillus zhongbaensis TaxID=2486009 RepID=UPI000F775CFB|nr:hypothetical protein [Companilactobacillus zhongbaensis]